MGCKPSKFDSLGTQYRFPVQTPLPPPPSQLLHTRKRYDDTTTSSAANNNSPAIVVSDPVPPLAPGHQPRSAIIVNLDAIVAVAMDAAGNHHQPEGGGGANNDRIVDTQPQTQSQSTNAWTNMDSQPIEAVVWGRLYPKSVKVKSLDLCRPAFAAGRDEANALCLTKRELPEKILCRISKVHFRISKDLADVQNPVYIEDLSRNGTFVNGEKIGHQQRQLLLNDDVISLSHPQYKAFVYKDLSPNESHGLPRAIGSQYHIGRKLGAGACGVVRLVYQRRTCAPYAMKHIRKNVLLSQAAAAAPPRPAPANQRQAAAQADRDAQRIANEGQIMRSLQHPCIVRMHDIIDCSDSVFIMLEVMRGGDLLSRIVGRKRLPERTARLYMVQLCEAVKYLHDKNITHRDLKPDNILLHTDDEETLVKVSDFGLSKAIGGDETVMRTVCGTPLYVAPEVLQTGGRGSYTNKVDVWSLGVVLFTCLSGTLPFSDEYGTPASEQIKKGRFQYRSPAWRGVSKEAKRLVERMLTVRAERRPAIDEVLADEWLREEETLRRAERIMKVPLTYGCAEAEPEVDEVEEEVGAAVDEAVAEAEMRPIEEVAVRDAEQKAPPLRMDIDVAMKCANAAAADGVEADEKMRTTPSPEPNAEDQENMSMNFLQPPAAKRRRIEQVQM